MLMGDGEEGMKVRRRVEEIMFAFRKAVQSGGSLALLCRALLSQEVAQ